MKPKRKRCCATVESGVRRPTAWITSLTLIFKRLPVKLTPLCGCHSGETFALGCSTTKVSGTAVDGAKPIRYRSSGAKPCVTAAVTNWPPPRSVSCSPSSSDASELNTKLQCAPLDEGEERRVG